MKMAKAYHKVLTIAGADPGGGAGIQADLKTIASLGCYGLTVITALTAQNTLGVGTVQPVSPPFVEEQLEMIFGDMGADAVKVGMVYSPDLIEVVARQLRKYGAENVVLDPVVASQSGKRLLMEEALETLKDQLMPLATVLTPNLPEASLLLGRPIPSHEERQGAARDLASFGSPYVLLKGGHSGSDASDLLYLAKEDRFTQFSGRRIATKNDHGTGCTLSSAIACHLARGKPVEDAVRESKAYIARALEAGAAYGLGKGRGPLHHFFDYWQDCP